MLSNSSCAYLKLQWANIYATIRRQYYAQVDGQSSQSSPAFCTPAYYPLSRTFLPHFLSSFLPVVTPAFRSPHSRFLPARRYASAGNSDRNVSVCLSVCPSRAGIVSKRRKLAA